MKKKKKNFFQQKIRARGFRKELSFSPAMLQLCSKCRKREKNCVEPQKRHEERTWRNSLSLVLYFRRTARMAQIVSHTKWKRVRSKKDSPKSQSKTLLYCRNYSRASDYEGTTYIPWLSTRSSQRVPISVSLWLTGFAEQSQWGQTCLLQVSTEDSETTWGVQIWYRLCEQIFVCQKRKA